jgi:hypothetical protein
VPRLDEGTLAYLTDQESVVVDVGRLLVGNATFNSTTFDVSSEDTNPESPAFSTDGTRLFLIGNIADRVFQYNLSNPFDLSTATFSGSSASIGGQVPTATALAFSDDGTRLFAGGPVDSDITQFDLSTPFDLSGSVSFSADFDVSPQEDRPQSVTFSADGTRMFVTGPDSDVYQFALGSAFDISGSVTNTAVLDVSAQDSFPTGVDFSDDGGQMFLLGGSTNTVYQFALDTAFDVSAGVTNTETFDLSNQTTNVTGFELSAGGGRMIVTDNGNERLLQYIVGSTKSV